MEKDTATVDMELEDGSKYTITLQESEVDEWVEIEEGTKALLCLADSSQIFIEVQSANWDGVSFKFLGGETLYHFEEEVISWLMVEVKE